jgi:hypothetical protein
MKFEGDSERSEESLNFSRPIVIVLENIIVIHLYFTLMIFLTDIGFPSEVIPCILIS